MRRHLLTREAVRAIERECAKVGLPESELMSAAGKGLADEAERLASDGLIAVLCGAGNNAGDGWVAANRLRSRGRDVIVLHAGADKEDAGLAGKVKADAIGAGTPHAVLRQCQGEDLEECLRGCVLVVDCIYGAGFHGQLNQPYLAWLEYVQKAQIPVLACDLPSGMEADSRLCAQGTPDCVCTMATIAVKIGMRTGKSHAKCGQVVVADLGVGQSLPGRIEGAALAQEWDADEYRALVPLPAYDSNKYSRGHVLVVAGSGLYPGAAVLCAQAAQRGGAGYVTLAVPSSQAALARSALLSAPVLPCKENADTFSASCVDAVLKAATGCDAVVAGPGLCLSEDTEALLKALLLECDKPLVLDADALNIASRHVEWLDARAGKAYRSVLTPHAGERARLLKGAGISEGCASEDEREDNAARIGNSQALARRFNAVVVDKGPETFCCDGDVAVLEADAPSSLAVAGSGDVLSGLCGSLLSCGLGALEASALATHMHALAGRLATQANSSACVIAEDVLKFVPQAYKLLLREG